MYQIKKLDWNILDHEKGPVWTSFGEGALIYSIEKHSDEYKLFHGYMAVGQRPKTLEETQGLAQKHFESQVMEYLNLSKADGGSNEHN